MRKRHWTSKPLPEQRAHLKRLGSTREKFMDRKYRQKCRELHELKTKIRQLLCS